MALPVATYKKAGGPLSVEVFVGSQSFGLYELWLWEPDGKAKAKLGEGINTDDKPDVHELATPVAAHDGKIVHWRIRSSPFNLAVGSGFTITATLRQDGVSLNGGHHAWTGVFAGAPIEIDGGVKLEAV